LYRFVARFASWGAVGLLFAAYLLCTVLFGIRQKVLGREHAVLDTLGWYTPEQAYKFLKAIGGSGRNWYAGTQLSLDLVFPACYAGLFAVLIVRLYEEGRARRLLLLPALTAVADWSENALTAYLAWAWTEGVVPTTAATAAACCTAAKFALVFASGAVIGWGGWVRLRRGELPWPPAS
jgi:hypothetical protein